MCISSVMAVVDGEVGSAITMQTALRIGETFNAHTALVQVLPPLAVCAPLYCEVKEQKAVNLLQNKSITLQEQQRERFETLYEDTVVKEGILSIKNTDRPKMLQFSATKWMITGHENQEVATRGRLFDIIVLPPASELPGGAKNATLEAALLDTGRPVLLAARATHFKLGQHVTIAWDGSRHAAISIRNALPIIQRAGRVDIIHATCGEVPSNSIESVANYLGLHGVEAQPYECTDTDAHPADVIIQSAQDNDSAIIVMGAHGISLDNDRACGSVAEKIIEHSPVPVFLSH
jgi:nucleotide-binding universal stress UspA family protein